MFLKPVLVDGYSSVMLNDLLFIVYSAVQIIDILNRKILCVCFATIMYYCLV